MFLSSVGFMLIHVIRTGAFARRVKRHSTPLCNTTADNWELSVLSRLYRSCMATRRLSRITRHLPSVLDMKSDLLPRRRRNWERKAHISRQKKPTGPLQRSRRHLDFYPQRQSSTANLLAPARAKARRTCWVVWMAKRSKSGINLLGLYFVPSSDVSIIPWKHLTSMHPRTSNGTWKCLSVV